MYEDTKDFIRRCGACQRHGNINSRDVMPLTNNLQIELFDVWGTSYIGPFPKSKNYEYILVVVDYVSKWVEAMPCKATDAKNSKKMFEEIIFPRFVMEELTSRTKTFTTTCQNMGFVTMSLLHITLRQVTKQKYQTNKSRIFYKRWSTNGDCMEG
jgi:hypothetical protein